MSKPLAAGRFFAEAFGVIRQQGRRMVAAAPWSFGLFVLSLPFALLVSRSFGSIQYAFLVLALVNMIALARMTFAWHRVIVLGDAVNAGGGGNAEAKHLALLMLFVIVAAAVLRATADMPIVIYFAMGGVGDTRFFVTLFAILAVLWVPMLYAGSVYALSLPRAAVAGEYGFREARAAMPFKRWPLAAALFALILSVGLAKVMMLNVANRLKVSDIAYGVLFLACTIIMTLVVTAMCAVAYRESTRGVKAA